MSVSLPGHATERFGFSSSREAARLRQATASPGVEHPRVPKAFGSPSSPPRLIGRGAETNALEALIAGVRQRGGAVVISGEAGIGKSALLKHARARASEVGAQTLVTVGAESEAELAFAGMHQLLRPIIEPAELLPTPQRSALEAAFGIRGDLEPDPFLVAL